jgi:ABC transport system ATP-binding/permease protein
MSLTTIVSSLTPFIELDNQGQVLRFRLERDCWQLGRDPNWSDSQIPPQGWDVISRRQAVLQRDGADYRIYDGDRVEPSRNGLFINHSRIDCHRGYPLKHGTQIAIGQNYHNQIMLTYFNPVNHPTTLPINLRLDLRSVSKFPVELGRETDPSQYGAMQLDSPVVSRCHATISQQPDGSYSIQDRST